MNKEIQKYNIEESVVVYRSADNAIQLEVQIAEETVWLTQNQIAELFGVKQPAISKHLSNIFREGELDKNSVHSILEYTAADGKKYQTQFYNLDAILSVGYRVNSVYATQFRQWANGVLKDYLLRGYAVNQQLLAMQRQMDSRFENQGREIQAQGEQIHELQGKVDFFIRTSLPPKEGVFVDGQIFDAFEFIERLIKSARMSIVLIDNYVDETVLTMMSKKQSGVCVEIYTKEISKVLQLTAEHFNMQYGGLTLKTTQICHDRFLIIDDSVIYHIGASLKDAGKRLFAFMQMNAEQITTIKERL